MPSKMQSSLALLIAMVGLMAGCKSPQAPPAAPQYGSGAQEYRLLANESAVAVLNTLSRLEQVAAQTNRCPPKVAAAFGDQVEHLQVQSIRIRARAQAIQARGDAYFEGWANGGPPGDTATPRLPPQNVSRLREGFVKIKAISQSARESFQPFLAGLRTLRAELLTDPKVIETEKTRELISTTRQHGIEVLRCLNTLRDELQSLQPAFAPSNPAKT